MRRSFLLLIGLGAFFFQGNAQNVTDFDGNIYHTVTIGTQIWMVENLKAIKYNDGSSIPLVTENTEWHNTTNPGYCWFNNDEVTFKDTYGALYNWYAVNTGKLCPTGWHVPTDAEWKTLTDYLGGENVAGGKLKETGTVHWSDPNTGATNETGFTALPGGDRHMFDGLFVSLNNYGSWWSSTVSDDTLKGWYRSMNYDNSSVSPYTFNKGSGLSVRCTKDIVVTVVKTIDFTDHIKIYPNPVTDVINIELIENRILNLEIYNLVGELMESKELTNITSEINIGFLSKGVYLLRIYDTIYNVQRKIIKE